jgi:hypothetical protein
MVNLRQREGCVAKIMDVDSLNSSLRSIGTADYCQSTTVIKNQMNQERTERLLYPAKTGKPTESKVKRTRTCSMITGTQVTLEKACFFR